LISTAPAGVASALLVIFAEPDLAEPDVLAGLEAPLLLPVVGACHPEADTAANMIVI
jgi:hypothetical protein